MGATKDITTERRSPKNTRALFRPEGKPAITVLVDPSHKAEAAMVEGILTGDIMQAVSKEAFSGPLGALRA